MIQNRLLYLLIAALFLLMLAGVAAAGMDGDCMGGKKVYTCACGADCSCGSVSMEPGKCSCGKDLMESKVLSEDSEKFFVCDCGPKCECSGVSELGDKCSCGKELKAYPKPKKAGCDCCRKG